jgi:type IV secretory pathway TrbL component
MDPTVFQKLIDAIQQALQPGMATLRPFLLFLISAFIALEGVRVWGSLLADQRHWPQVVSFLVRTLAGVVIYWGWPSILTTLTQDFAQAGLRFAGSPMTVKQFLDPGAILAQGLTSGGVLKNLVLANAGLTGAVYFFPFLGCWLCYLLAFALMSCNVFLAQVELAILLPVSMLALGLVFWAPTRQMAAGVFSYALGMGLKFFLQAILASLLFQLIPLLTTTATTKTVFDTAMENALLMVIAAGLMAYMFWKVPSMVAQHLTGAPSLSFGGAFQAVAGVVGLGTGVATGTVLASRASRAAVQRVSARVSGSSASGGSATGDSTPRLPLPPVRSQPPPLPSLQHLNNTLRAGAQFLGHDQSGPGPTVSL